MFIGILLVMVVEHLQLLEFVINVMIVMIMIYVKLAKLKKMFMTKVILLLKFLIQERNFSGGRRCGGWGNHYGYYRRSQPNFLARFVSDVTFPDGSIVNPGQQFTKIWRMRNEGPSDWPENSSLTFISGDKLSNEISVVLPFVPANSEIDIAVPLVAPSSAGRYISYLRLSTPDGNRFGQKIWLDLIVSEKQSEVKKEESKPVEIKKEEPKPVEIKKEEPKPVEIKKRRT